MRDIEVHSVTVEDMYHSSGIFKKIHWYYHFFIAKSSPWLEDNRIIDTFIHEFTELTLMDMLGLNNKEKDVRIYVEEFNFKTHIAHILTSLHTVSGGWTKDARHRIISPDELAETILRGRKD